MRTEIQELISIIETLNARNKAIQESINELYNLVYFYESEGIYMFPSD